MNSIKGNIFNIQRFCLEDGPGIRTTIFFKGCPLRCIWCHNPESFNSISQISYSDSLCINCGKCTTVCENHDINDNFHIYNRNGCSNCGKCVTICPTGALELAGSIKSIDEILPILLSDLPFFKSSGGGITISGGEPFLQSEFLVTLLKKLKEYNIHTCVETSGFTLKSNLEKAVPYIDLFLYDFKASSEQLHQLYTNVSNRSILENLEYLNSNGKEIILRCPIIPNYNDNDDHFNAIKELKTKYNNIKKVEIMPYHNLGLSKIERFNLDIDNLNTYVPTKEQVKEWYDKINL